MVFDRLFVFRKSNQRPMVLVGAVCFTAVVGMLTILNVDWLAVTFVTSPQTAFVILVCLVGALLTSLLSNKHLRHENTQMRTAFDSMAQGLCMFDAAERLIVCNSQYSKMYGLASDDVRPGTTLSEILAKRVAKGTFARDPEQYRREFLSEIARGCAMVHEVKTMDGRALLVKNHPMKGGGWIGTHEDITERRQTEQDKRVATEREAALENMAREFEEAVGGIVKAAVAGDFSRHIDLAGKTGMVLNIGTALNSLCADIAKVIDDLIDMLDALANGDLTQRMTTDYKGKFAVLADNANKSVERIGATIAEIKASAREVTNASAEISTSTTDLSQRTEEQAASLEETSASMEEISVTVKRNAEYAQAANQSASGTRDVADRGGQVVAKAVEAMAKIEESSRKISDIIGVIDEIARQTNLLALNAAVEAARAGEAGRGFAVVASEVRSLAQRSSQAAKDIKDLITNSNDQVKGGVELVNRAGASLTEIVDSITKVAEIVADIANASNEQSTGIEQVNKALTQMDEVTQQNSALVEENAATAKTLEHQAKAMDERVSFFKLDAAAEARPVAKPAAKPTREQRPAAAPPSRGPAAAKQPVMPKQQPAAVPKRAASATNAGGPVRRMQAALATAVNSEPDWKEF